MLPLPRLQSVKITTQATTEPVTLTEVKSRLRVTDTTDDALITQQITIARVFAEKIAGGRSLAGKAYAAYYECFPCTGYPLILPFPPVASVQAVKYLDPATQTWLTWNAIDTTVTPNLPEYLVGTMQEPCVIVESWPYVYPDTFYIQGYPGVEVDFTSGVYAGQGAELIMEGVRALAVFLYSHPEMEENSYPTNIIKMMRSAKLYGF